jgi:ATP-dependent helicase HrpB
MRELPIEPVVAKIRDALRVGRNLVLQAPPGAGKTTRVPLALLDEPWLAGRRIVMLEPRRLATRAAARRMAAMRGENVGETVGYRMRLDSRVGTSTRIEVVTDGILIRMLQDNPSLDGVGAVIFDEFHERGIDADLGLALCLEAQTYLREDLRLVVMSATLDGARVAKLLGDAPIVTSEGRSFPVETRYLDRPASDRFEAGVVAAIHQAVADEDGSMLVFLPGAGEIRRVERMLGEFDLGPGIAIAPLYGELAQDAQDAALLPASPGTRKIVLSTSIAETSLTIDGIRIVVDGGLMRVPRFDLRSGMTRLETIRVSQASADQRRGRAGRLEPGICYRLWPEAEQRALAPYTMPEILAADLAPLALELACWGVSDPAKLGWLDPLPDASYRQARDLLLGLDALDSQGQVTAHGREMARFGMHPRLAHMILAGAARGAGGIACDIAAILSTRDLVKPRGGTTRGGPARDADLRLRLDILSGTTGETELPGLAIDRGLLKQVRQQATDWRRRVKAKKEDGRRDDAGLILAEAYPDRIAQIRPGGNGQFLMSNGRGAALPPIDPLAAEDYLAVADLDGDKREARIFLAAPLNLVEIEDAFADRLVRRDLVEWNAREGAVVARKQLRLGNLTLRDEVLSDPPPEAVMAALLEGIRQTGLACLPWNREIDTWRRRVAFLRSVQGPDAGWPDLSDAALLASLEDWLAPSAVGIRRLTHLSRIDLAGILRTRLDWKQQRALEALAPTHIVVPSGSRLAIDYTDDRPTLSVRLQEMFGSATTPSIVDGKVPLRLQLLSPAGRPMQVTNDLAGFWTSSYAAVRSEMRGRYPKHPWPEDPRNAEPTSRAKRRH